jgi:hypothetical protein
LEAQNKLCNSLLADVYMGNCSMGLQFLPSVLLSFLILSLLCPTMLYLYVYQSLDQ